MNSDKNLLSLKFKFLNSKIGLLLIFSLCSFSFEKIAFAGGGSQEIRPEAMEMLELVNELREEEGLVSLEILPSCQEAAQYHAESMVERDYFSHDGFAPDGEAETWRERMERFELLRGAVGENIVKSGSVESAFRRWLNSPNHKKNILSARFRSTGMGYREGHWVQCFSSVLPD